MMFVYFLLLPLKFLQAHRIKTLSLIIQKLDPKHDVETINNAAYLICETFGKYNTMHHGREVLSSLLDEVTISYFFSVLQIKVIYSLYFLC